MIESKSEYDSLMKKIDMLMKKGEGNLTEKENTELLKLAMKVQAYEKLIYKKDMQL